MCFRKKLFKYSHKGTGLVGNNETISYSHKYKSFFIYHTVYIKYMIDIH